jgi:hypothetical protein
MKNVVAVSIWVVPMLLPFTIYAGTTHYECVVASAMQLNESGMTEATFLTKKFVGASFTVDRESGRIIGGPLDNAKMKTDVVDRGTSEMSFQAFSRSSPLSHTTHIEVQEFVRGPNKPFVATTTVYYPGIYTGRCK